MTTQHTTREVTLYRGRQCVFPAGTRCTVLSEEALVNKVGSIEAAALRACRSRMQGQGQSVLYVEIGGGVACLEKDVIVTMGLYPENVKS